MMMTRLRRWFGRDKPHAGPSGSPEHVALFAGEPSPDAPDDFASAMYAQLPRKGNLCFSPLSIHSVVGMAYAGARGETAADMRAGLHIEEGSDESFHRDSGAVLRRLNRERDENGEIVVANSVWSQSGGELQTAFVERLAACYQSEINAVDFERDPAAAASRINAWVSDATRRRIQQLLAPSDLDPPIGLVLANAVYFKGSWRAPFRPGATEDKPFRLGQGQSVSAPMMQQQSEVGYLQARGYQVLELTYRGNDLAMLVVLPERDDGLAELEKKLSARMLHDCVAGLTYRRVDVYLPRFTIRPAAMNVVPPLRALGMSRPFDRRAANFSGINGRYPPDPQSLFISAILHKAFVQVDERGTEAAAATVTITQPMLALRSVKPPPVPIFRADHPFLFAIWDRTSSALLFLGRVRNPVTLD